jgi:polysaccharide export outer membrane protein
LYAAALYAIRYGRLEDAVKYLQEVLKWDPRHEGAWRKLVEVRQELERQQRMGLYMKAQELTKSLETIQRWKQELIGAQVDSNTLAAIYEKERRKRELVEEAEKQKTGGQPQPAEELSEDVAKEKARLALLEAEREQLLSDSYAYAQGLLANSRIDEALAEFQEIQRAEPNFRNTNIFIADIYKAKEAEKREVEPPKYTLGPDDIIEINVLSHPEFSGGVVVEGGGEIIMPMLKEVVMANGLTKDELAERIKELLKKYIKDPEVQVVIKGYNSKKWYILGEVASKGEYPLGKTNLTLLEALYAAGLPLEGTSAMRRVILIKPHKTSPRYRSINVFDILYYGRLQDNVRIEPGDIIYVPKTVLSKVNYMVGAIFAPITAMKTGVQDLKGLSDAAKAITPLKYLWEPDKKTTGSAASTTP